MQILYFMCSLFIIGMQKLPCSDTKGSMVSNAFADKRLLGQAFKDTESSLSLFRGIYLCYGSGWKNDIHYMSTIRYTIFSGNLLPIVSNFFTLNKILYAEDSSLELSSALYWFSPFLSGLMLPSPYPSSLSTHFQREKLLFVILFFSGNIEITFNHFW